MARRKQPYTNPPATLSRRAKDQWRRYLDEFAIEDAHGLFILKTAMEAYDDLLAAQACVREHGATFVNRHGDRKANPAMLHARDARGQMLAALRHLNLDVLPPGKPGAPSKR